MYLGPFHVYMFTPIAFHHQNLPNSVEMYNVQICTLLVQKWMYSLFGGCGVGLCISHTVGSGSTTHAEIPWHGPRLNILT